MKQLFTTLAERGLSILAFFFPFIEVASYFGPKVFLGTESLVLKSFYLNYLQKFTAFYTNNNLLVFIFMVWIFLSLNVKFEIDMLNISSRSPFYHESLRFPYWNF